MITVNHIWNEFMNYKMSRCCAACAESIPIILIRPKTIRELQKSVCENDVNLRLELMPYDNSEAKIFGMQIFETYQVKEDEIIIR